MPQQTDPFEAYRRRFGQLARPEITDLRDALGMRPPEPPAPITPPEPSGFEVRPFATPPDRVGPVTPMAEEPEEQPGFLRRLFTEWPDPGDTGRQAMAGMGMAGAGQIETAGGIVRSASEAPRRLGVEPLGVARPLTAIGRALGERMQEEAPKIRQEQRAVYGEPETAFGTVVRAGSGFAGEALPYLVGGAAALRNLPRAATIPSRIGAMLAGEVATGVPWDVATGFHRTPEETFSGMAAELLKEPETRTAIAERVPGVSEDMVQWVFENAERAQETPVGRAVFEAAVGLGMSLPLTGALEFGPGAVRAGARRTLVPDPDDISAGIREGVAGVASEGAPSFDPTSAEILRRRRERTRPPEPEAPPPERPPVVSPDDPMSAQFRALHRLDEAAEEGAAGTPTILDPRTGRVVGEGPDAPPRATETPEERIRRLMGEEGFDLELEVRQMLERGEINAEQARNAYASMGRPVPPALERLLLPGPDATGGPRIRTGEEGPPRGPDPQPEPFLVSPTGGRAVRQEPDFDIDMAARLERGDVTPEQVRAAYEQEGRPIPPAIQRQLPAEGRSGALPMPERTAAPEAGPQLVGPTGRPLRSEPAPDLPLPERAPPPSEAPAARTEAPEAPVRTEAPAPGSLREEFAEAVQGLPQRLRGPVSDALDATTEAEFFTAASNLQGMRMNRGDADTVGRLLTQARERLRTPDPPARPAPEATPPRAEAPDRPEPVPADREAPAPAPEARAAEPGEGLAPPNPQAQARVLADLRRAREAGEAVPDLEEIGRLVREATEGDPAARRRLADDLDPERAQELRLAYEDDLTGLPNHRAFEQARSRVDDNPDVEVAYVDVRDLHSLNQVGGRQAGDQQIILTADAMRGAARTVGIDNRAVFRISGDEFAAIVPTGQADAFNRAVRDAVPDTPIEGTNLFTGVRTTKGATLEEADAALSAMKEADTGPRGRPVERTEGQADAPEVAAPREDAVDTPVDTPAPSAPRAAEELPPRVDVGERIHGVDGNETWVHMPEGPPVRAIYRVVELEDLVPSHDPFSWSPREGYPGGVQNRRYESDKAAQGRLEGRVREFNAEKPLDLTIEAGSGPPTMRQDGVTAAGNDRTMTLERLAVERPEEFAKYRARLIEERAAQVGVNPEEAAALRQPVLVREIVDEGVDLGDRSVLRELNRRSDIEIGKGKDPVSDAATRAAVLRERPAALEHLADTMAEGQTLRAYLGTAAGRRFIEILEQGGVITRDEIGRFRDARTGALTDQGADTIERLIQVAAIGDADVVSLARENARAILAQMEHAFPAIVRASTTADWDVRGTLQDALRLHVELRGQSADSNIRTINDLVEPGPGQQTTFIAREDAPEAVTLARFLESANKAETKSAFHRFAKDADLARREAGQETLFEVTARTPSQAFDEAFGAPDRMARSKQKPCP